MKKLEGMLEAFKEAKLVFLTTSSNNKTHTRPMTNYNESPYISMWFPSFRDTKKIDDIKTNPSVVVSFPAKKEGMWFRVNGKAKLAPWEEVKEMWRWWLLDWLPEEKRRPLQYDNPFLDRAIIWIEPIEATLGDSK
jgi:general stress protein 26